MNQSKNPFEVAAEEEEESPPDSPVGHDQTEAQTAAAPITVGSHGADTNNAVRSVTLQKTTIKSASTSAGTKPAGKNKEDDDEEEEEHMDAELNKLSSYSDPSKMQLLISWNNIEDPSFAVLNLYLYHADMYIFYGPDWKVCRLLALQASWNYSGGYLVGLLLLVGPSVALLFLNLYSMKRYINRYEIT